MSVAVDQFVQGLAGIPRHEFSVPNVARYMAKNPIDPGSMEPYLFYEPTHYTRNLVYKCDMFEVVAVCWDVGQASQVHNHQGQNCWMAAPMGRLAVQNYELVRSDDRGFCELRPGNRVVMDPGHPAHVDPAQPIHAVLNLAEFEQRATSLHVYSLPYDRCLVYAPDRNAYWEVPLSYDSEYGRPSPPTL